jgi:tetratricopeptide (TPR) repeat protein
MVRATAISYLSAYKSPAADSIIKEMLYNTEPLVRERAIDAFTTNDEFKFVNALTPLLNDPIKMVRIAAASKLSVLRKDYFSVEQFEKLTEVLNEYLETLKYTADFPTGKYNLGNFYSNKGNFIKAEKYYQDAIKMDQGFYPAKSNLAMLYYNNGNLKEAEDIFLELIKDYPDFTDGEYYLGLLYAEQQRYKESADILEKATLKANVNPRIYYNLGLVYQYLNNLSKTESSLLKAYSLSPNEFDVLYALADFYIKREKYQDALKYAEELKIHFPSNPAGEQLRKYIEGKEKTKPG